MRSDPTHFALTAPATLTEALTLLAQNQHTPIAGGTELMVAFNTGRLTQTSLLSIHHLRELRFIRHDEPTQTIHIGSGVTFTDIRNHPAIAQHLPLLIQSASWTGSIANQNRATLGGNLCNASPAADTPPALLCYNATLTLISASAAAGKPAERQIPYRDFHLGYKRTAVAPNELLHTISIPIPPPNTRHYLRKVGTRNAQAISKIALAAVAFIEDQKIQTLRLAAASLADRPLRLLATEAALLHRSLAPADLDATLRTGRASLALEAHPIDDIRSTARYRSIVAANLLEEFLRSLTV